MASFYKRFVRDFMRYKDSIQCAGHELIQAVRQDSIALDPEGKGEYYALHIRRGDFQYHVRCVLSNAFPALSFMKGYEN